MIFQSQAITTPRIPLGWGFDINTSNFESNLLFGTLEVGHWVAQTWPFFDGLASYNNLRIRHYSEFAKYYTRKFQM